MLRGKLVNFIGKPHNLFRETLVNVIGKQCRWGNTITFIGKGLQELLKFPTTVFPYNVYKFSLKRLWGSPITFTILPISIKDFPCNFIVVSLCIVFPYHFYKYGMYFPRKSLHSLYHPHEKRCSCRLATSATIPKWEVYIFIRLSLAYLRLSLKILKRNSSIVHSERSDYS